MERRPAAILMADVIGYSRLMEADETGTLGILKQQRTLVLDPAVRSVGARIVKVMGEMASPSDRFVAGGCRKEARACFARCIK